MIILPSDNMPENKKMSSIDTITPGSYCYCPEMTSQIKVLKKLIIAWARDTCRRGNETFSFECAEMVSRNVDRITFCPSG